jgi:cation transport regulator ChaC
LSSFLPHHRIWPDAALQARKGTSNVSANSVVRHFLNKARSMAATKQLILFITSSNRDYPPTLTNEQRDTQIRQRYASGERLSKLARTIQYFTSTCVSDYHAKRSQLK